MTEKQAEKWTNNELSKLEKRIKEQYKQASEEVKARSDEYFVKFRKRYKQEYKAYQDGKYTRDEFKRWYYSQVGRGEHWKELQTQLAERMTQADIIAAQYINGTLPAIYAQNSNSIAEIATKSAMEQGVAGVRFDLVDEHVVRNLMENSSAVKPYKPVSISLDKNTRYSKNKLQNALLQGILQGDSIDKIADRFVVAVGMGMKSAVRNARTAVTGAQSAGKQDRYEELAEKGCDVTKIWVATDDERTRPEHMEADGQEVPHNEPFDVGGEELMHPGDPSGSGWNIYNCRCTMKTGKIRFHSILSEEQRQKANIRLKV